MSSAKSSTAADVADAVDAAKVNLAEWQSRPIRERAQVFYNLRSIMHQNLKNSHGYSSRKWKDLRRTKAEVLKRSNVSSLVVPS